MKETRTYAQRRQYLIEAVKKRRHRLKELALQDKGGKCERCGYDRFVGALEFHHLDATQKTFAIGGKGYTRSWEAVKAELNKCILVCANCHREIEAGLAQIP